jgi:hypothetical protein
LPNRRQQRCRPCWLDPQQSIRCFRAVRRNPCRRVGRARPRASSAPCGEAAPVKPGPQAPRGIASRAGFRRLGRINDPLRPRGRARGLRPRKILEIRRVFLRFFSGRARDRTPVDAPGSNRLVSLRSLQPNDPPAKPGGVPVAGPSKGPFRDGRETDDKHALTQSIVVPTPSCSKPGSSATGHDRLPGTSNFGCASPAEPGVSRVHEPYGAPAVGACVRSTSGLLRLALLRPSAALQA